MKQFFFLFFLISFYFIGYANKTRFYIASKGGITITIGGTYEDTVAQQNLLNSYLDFIIKKLPTQLGRPKMIIMIGDIGIRITKRKLWKEYAYVCVDTLLKPDTVFVNSSQSNYYNLPAGHNYFLSVPYALSGQKQLYFEKDIGILIRILSFDTSISNIIDRIITIAQFSIDNIALIQEKQSSIRMPSHLYGESISIVTYDTSKIGALKTVRYGHENRKNFFETYRLGIWVLFIAFFILVCYIEKALKKTLRFDI